MFLLFVLLRVTFSAEWSVSRLVTTSRIPSFLITFNESLRFNGETSAGEISLFRNIPSLNVSFFANEKLDYDRGSQRFLRDSIIPFVSENVTTGSNNYIYSSITYADVFDPESTDPVLFRAVYKNYPGRIAYVGNIDQKSQWLLECFDVVEFSYEPFTCRFRNSVYTFHFTEETNGQMTLRFNATETDPQVRMLLSLSCYRLQRAHLLEFSIVDAAASNELRKIALRGFAFRSLLSIGVYSVMSFLNIAIWIAVFTTVFSLKTSSKTMCLALFIGSALLTTAIVLPVVYLSKALGTFVLLMCLSFVLFCIPCCYMSCLRTGRNMKTGKMNIHKSFGFKQTTTVRYEKASTPCKSLVIMCNILLWLCFLLIIFGQLVLFPQQYFVHDRMTGLMFAEHQELNAVRGVSILYSYEDAEDVINGNALLVVATNLCEDRYNSTLPDSWKGRRINNGFIVEYNVDMSEFDPSDYMKYDTVNEWFARKLAQGARPIYVGDQYLTSPVDGRVIGFETVDETMKLWLKGTTFSVHRLLGEELGAMYGEEFVGGTVLIFRLAPGDYHRFHAPFSCKVTASAKIPGEYNSVNAEAVQSGTDILDTNVRVVNILRSNNNVNVAYVAVGATCLGSIVMNAPLGTTLEKGQDMGYFQFGGSTVVVLIPKDTVRIDGDIAMNSDLKIETKVMMGMSFSQWL